jgi:hypothetical protein
VSRGPPEGVVLAPCPLFASSYQSWKIFMQSIVPKIDSETSYVSDFCYSVLNLASELAKSEENVKDKEVVQLAALLHDIDDWKYSGRCETVSRLLASFFPEQNSSL